MKNIIKELNLITMELLKTTSITQIEKNESVINFRMFTKNNYEVLSVDFYKDDPAEKHAEQLEKIRKRAKLSEKLTDLKYILKELNEVSLTLNDKITTSIKIDENTIEFKALDKSEIIHRGLFFYHDSEHDANLILDEIKERLEFYKS